MANDIAMFLRLDGIKGESTADGHVEEIEILSWRTSDSSSQDFGGFLVRKHLDSASVPLRLLSLTGAHVAYAVLAVRRLGETFDYWVVTVEDAHVNSVIGIDSVGPVYPVDHDTLQSGADKAGIVESLAIWGRKVYWKYKAAVDAVPVKGGWDNESKKPLVVLPEEPITIVTGPP
jgi:type VI protein secretion system component Hcp